MFTAVIDAGKIAPGSPAKRVVQHGRLVGRPKMQVQVPYCKLFVAGGPTYSRTVCYHDPVIIVRYYKLKF